MGRLNRQRRLSQGTPGRIVEILRRGPLTFEEIARAMVFAAGDLVNGGTTVVRAVAEGRDAATEIDARLMRA